MQLDSIYQPVQLDLVRVNERLKEVSRVGFLSLSQLLGYSLDGTGKGIRPALTLLAGKSYDYDVVKLLYMAVGVELLHTATLIHDDAIDKSSMRRGRPTINKVWGEEKAILLGDYLFAKAGESVADTRNLHVVKLFAQTLMTISSGEINQIANSYNLAQTREDYLRRIASKTASLFSLATESGAVLSQAPEEAVLALQQYGNYLGIAFQIVDDILDYTGTEEELGKPVASDLTQGTLTLPAMLLLEHYPEDNPVERWFQKRDNQENIKQAVEMVLNSLIIDECHEIAASYCAKACDCLKVLPDSNSRRSLTRLTDYVLSRKK